MRKYIESLADKAEARRDEKLYPDPAKPRYVGLNMRIFANLTDLLCIFLITMPFLYLLQGMGPHGLPADVSPQVMEATQAHDAGQISNEEYTEIMVKSGTFARVIVPRLILVLAVNFFVFGVVIVAFWRFFDATPGKMLLRAKIVDEKTLGKPTLKQYIIRFITYGIGIVPAGMGYLIISFNSKKRGFHDYMSGTAVVYSNKLNPEWEKKKFKFQVYLMVALLIIVALYIARKMQ